MAKTANKSKTTIVNQRSRAAKRATSPSIDIDKSIKDAPRALGTDPILGISRNSGVSKKKKSKQMTRGQRARQERGLARAEAVMDQMEKKVDDARSKLKKRHMRKALWDDVNLMTVDEQRKAMKGPGRETVAGNNEDQENTQTQEEDINMGVTTSTTGSNPILSQQQSSITQIEPQAAFAPPADESDLIS